LIVLLLGHHDSSFVGERRCYLETGSFFRIYSSRYK
jgi:hypothetical protein